MSSSLQYPECVGQDLLPSQHGRPRARTGPRWTEGLRLGLRLYARDDFDEHAGVYELELGERLVAACGRCCAQGEVRRR